MLKSMSAAWAFIGRTDTLVIFLRLRLRFDEANRSLEIVWSWFPSSWLVLGHFRGGLQLETDQLCSTRFPFFFPSQLNTSGSSSWFWLWRTLWRCTPGPRSPTTSSWPSRWVTLVAGLVSYRRKPRGQQVFVLLLSTIDPGKYWLRRV